jgi:Sec-independent protein translocase protein TatA
LSGTGGGALFVGLSNQLRDVDGAAHTAGTRGIRTLTSNLASMAAMELGVRSGLGSFVSILGSMTLGAGLTLGVVAGLAAIAYGMRKLGEAAAEAKKHLEDARTALTKVQDARKEWLRAQQGPVVAGAVDVRAAQTEQRTATDALAESTRKLAAAQERVAFAERAARTDPNMLPAVQIATRDLATARTNAEAATVRLATADADLTTKQEQLAKATADANAVTDKSTAAHAGAALTVEEHARALVALASAGIATAADLAELTTLEAAFAAATRVGTSEARAQALALSQLIQSAREARLLGLLGPDAFKQKARLSPTSPPGYRPMAPAPGTVPGPDPDAAWNALPEKTKALITFRDEMEATAQRMGSIQSILEASGQAFLHLWDAIGSGEGIGAGVKQALAGMARYFAQYAMAKALFAFAEGLMGNPKAFAAGGMYLAAAAALSAFGGAMSSGGGGGGGGRAPGGAGGSAWNDTYRDYTVPPRMQPAGASATAASASRLQPAQAVVINQTIIGERDPVAQRELARMTSNAARRGYATQGAR